MDRPRLSEFPAKKIVMDCKYCAIRVQYDRDACLAAGGDRTLIAFRDEVRERKRCKGHAWDGNKTMMVCGLRYTDLVELMARNKGGR